MNEKTLLEIIDEFTEEMNKCFVKSDGLLSKYDKAALYDLITVCEQFLYVNKGVTKLKFMKEMVEFNENES